MFRDSFNNMLRRSHGGIGVWIVIRHFSTVKSRFWNEETKESIGGPPYEYTDTVTLGAKQTAFSTTRPAARVGTTLMVEGGAILETYKYFLQSDVTIKEDDEILDLAYSGQPTPVVDYTGTGKGAKITSRFKVKFIDDQVQGNRGDLGYKLIVAERTYVA